jgi:Kae1-associated kinase Bud32
MYTKPELRKRLKAKIKVSFKGGGYSESGSKKKTQKALDKWNKEDGQYSYGSNTVDTTVVPKPKNFNFTRQSEVKVSAHRRDGNWVKPFLRKHRKKIATGVALTGATTLGLISLKNRKPLGQLVGSGYQGKVYRSETIATKVFNKKAFAKKEFNLLKAIEDTGVAPKPYEIQGNRVLMEAVEGKNIKDVLPDSSTDSLSNLAKTVADSLKQVHEKGVMHGDLKLDNIMVSSDNKIRIIDFASGFKSDKKVSPYVDLDNLAKSVEALFRSNPEKAKSFTDSLYRRYFDLDLN